MAFPVGSDRDIEEERDSSFDCVPPTPIKKAKLLGNQLVAIADNMAFTGGSKRDRGEESIEFFYNCASRTLK